MKKEKQFIYLLSRCQLRPEVSNAVGEGHHQHLTEVIRRNNTPEDQSSTNLCPQCGNSTHEDDFHRGC